MIKGSLRDSGKFQNLVDAGRRVAGGMYLLKTDIDQTLSCRLCSHIYLMNRLVHLLSRFKTFHAQHPGQPGIALAKERSPRCPPFEVQPYNPETYIAATLLLGMIALVATLIPVPNAMRGTLRGEGMGYMSEHGSRLKRASRNIQKLKRPLNCSTRGAAGEVVPKLVI